MPPSKPKPSEIAAEAKKTYIPYILHNYSTTWPATSYLCSSGSLVGPGVSGGYQTKFGFVNGDPIDCAIEWAEGDYPIPVVMPAHETRPGGDWESGVMAPEECLCRRSNLVAALTSPATNGTHYPIPLNSGIWSQSVVVFRDGPDKYQPYEQYKALPIISVPPVRRPKLDSSEKNYSFTQEKDEMKEQLRTALRIAVWAKHYKICIGSFGLGPGFKNPPEEVAIMWKELLLDDSEFFGFFSDVVFAFESPEGPASSTTSSSSSSKPSSKSSKSSSSRSSSSRSSSSKHNFREDLDVFRRVFNPAALYGATRLL